MNNSYVMPFNAKAALYAVLGCPVHHSLSPWLHNRWFWSENVNAVYIPLSVTPNALQTVVQALPALGFCGWNVTVPHKQAILPLVGTLSPLATMVGAVNTVRVQPDGTLYGENTDVAGFMETLCSKNIEKERPVLVLGAGGAARAILWALQQKGFSVIRVMNRTAERLQQLASLFPGSLHPVEWMDWTNGLAEVSMVVNTTSMVHTSGEEGLSVPWHLTSSDCLAYDISYAKGLTPFLKEAARSGRATKDGLEMLVEQAREAWRVWCGYKPPWDEQAEIALREQL
jgi:shikimate dehydrogenase